VENKDTRFINGLYKVDPEFEEGFAGYAKVKAGNVC
jgi:hypothetical protein